jgi:hypothetical protein
MTREDLFFWISRFTVSAIVMMNPIGNRVFHYVLICNFVVWVVLVYLFVLVVR